MTRLDLQNLTLRWLSDPEGGYFTPSYVQQLLNNAQREVQKELLQAGQNWYVVCTTTLLNTSTPHYALPEDFRTMHKLDLIISGLGTPNEVHQTLTPCTLIEQDFFAPGQGVPQSYTIKKKSITLAPWPDNTYYLKAQYSYMVADMFADNSSPDVPEQYEEYIAVIATIDGLLQDNRNVSDFITGKRDMYQKLMRQDAQQRRKDAPRMVVQTEDDATGWFF